MKPILALLTLLVSLTLLACKKESASPITPTSTHVEITFSYVYADSLGLSDNTGLYYKTANWVKLGGDSVIKVLLDSNLSLSEFWYPTAPGPCLDPTTHEREIARLINPDTSIYRFGYTPLAPGYNDFCLPLWRHYSIRRVPDGN
jgi:hypothetical protein